MSTALLPGIDARPHEPQVSAWMAALATMAGRDNANEAAAAREMKLIVPALAEAFPSQAFSQRSLRHVAAEMKRWGYAFIHAALRDWWAQNQPAAQLLVSPELDHLEAMDRLWVTYWQKHRPERAEEEAKIREEGNWRDPHQLPLARLASLVRSQSPAAWAHISGDTKPEKGTPSEADSAAVRKASAEAIEAMHMAAAPRAHSIGRQMAAVGGLRREPDRPLGAISPERLAAEREAAGIRPVAAPVAEVEAVDFGEEPPPGEVEDYV